MIRIFQICFDSKSFLSFYVDVSAEDFAKSVTQTFGKRVCLRVFCNFCTFQKDKKTTFSLFIIFVTCHDLVLAGNGTKSCLGFSWSKVSCQTNYFFINETVTKRCDAVLY